MSVGILAKTAEISERLRSILLAKGLKPRLERTSTKATIAFVVPRKDVWSPVHIELVKQPTHRRGMEWQIQAIDVDNYEEYVFANGWRHFSPTTISSIDVSAMDPDDVYAKIEQLLETKGLVLGGENHPNYTDDWDFVEAVLDAQEHLEGLGSETITCSREIGIKSFAFLDRNNRDWRITFSEGEFSIYLDGDFVEHIPAKRSHEVAATICTLAASPSVTFGGI